MKYVKEKAIILGNRDFGEADRLVAFLTENHGKVVGVAKHARRSKKRFVNSLDVFNLVDIEYGERRLPGLVFIKGARLKEAFSGLRENVLKLSCAGLLVEAINGSVPEREVQPEIHGLLKMSLARIEQTNDPINTVCLSLWKLLGMLGLSPRLDRCLICKRKCSTHDMWFFDYALGGLVCSNHGRNRKYAAILNKGIISLLEKAKVADMTRLWRFKICPDDKLAVLGMLVEYFQFHMDKPLRSVRVISQLGYEVGSSNERKRIFNNKNTVPSC